MGETTNENFQAEFSDWAKKELVSSGHSIRWLASKMGMDATSLNRRLNGRRGMDINEVAKIALSLRKVPPAWNRIRRLAHGGNLLPLMGRVNSGVWSKRGTGMPKGLAPIERVLTEDDEEEQVSYFIETGKQAGQYAICNKNADLNMLGDNALVIVEESMLIGSPNPVDSVRLTLRKCKKISGGVELLPFREDDLSPIRAPSERVHIEALVRWFLIPASEVSAAL